MFDKEKYQLIVVSSSLSLSMLRDARDLTQPDVATISADAGEEGALRRAAAPALELPMLELIEAARRAVDGGADFDQRSVLPLREEGQHGGAFTLRCFRRDELTATVGVQFQQLVITRQPLAIGVVVAPVELCGQLVQGRLRVSAVGEFGTPETLGALLLPALLWQQVIVERAVFVRVREIQSPGFERVGDASEE